MHTNDTHYLDVHFSHGKEVLVGSAATVKASTEVWGHGGPSSDPDVLGQVPVQHDHVGQLPALVPIPGVGQAALRHCHTFPLQQVGPYLEGHHLKKEDKGQREMVFVWTRK